MSTDSSKKITPKATPAAVEPSPGTASLPEQYRSVTWGPIFGLVMVVVSFVAAQIVADIVIMRYASGMHLGDSWISSTTAQFFYILLAEGFAVLLLWLFLHNTKATFKSIGFSRKARGGDVAYAFAIGLGYFAVLYVVVAIVSAAFNLNVDQKQELGFDTVTGHLQLIMTFISLVILPPIVEETLFRGVLFGGFRTKMPFIYATLLTSVLFALPHLFESGSGLLWIGGIDTFILSIALCYLREKTGSLWAGIFLHMIKNGTAFLFLYVFIPHTFQ